MSAAGADTAPLVLGVAPNGAYKTVRDHPRVPVTRDAIVADAIACRDAGASLFHLHVRDAAGRHLLDAPAYRDATAAIRRAVGDTLVVQITTEAASRYGRAAQMAVVRAVRPEAVSIALRELVPDAPAEPEAHAFFAWLRAENVMPQYILYSPDEVARYRDLRARGVIPAARDFLLFVLGRYSTGQVSAPADLLPFLQAHDGTTPWATCAFGPGEAACAMAAAALGGHVRVGLENNLYLPDGTLAPDNATLVRNAAAGAAIIGRRLASADEVREMLGSGRRG
ncbi:MAG: 3-keto-5-aminohexanoate cleavage protein [Rudaea sp.]